MDHHNGMRMRPSTPANSAPPSSGSTRKKACRKCTQSKVRCDLAKPKCNRCAARGCVCEYPTGRITRPNIGTSRNQRTTSELNQPHGIFERVPASTEPPDEFWNSASHLPALGGVSVPPHPDPSLYEESDLVPMADAGEIRDRWLRPYISASTGQKPKQLNPHTIQYLTCMLKSYLRNLSNAIFPPFVHHSQYTESRSPVLSYCCANIRTWLGKSPEYEIFIMETIREEMRKIENQEVFRSDFDMLCSFQAYLLYSMALHFFPMSEITEISQPDSQFQIKMQEIAFRSAKTGLLCKAEESRTRPHWESWIVASSKRRTLFAMYLFTSVYNSQVGLPNFVAEELKGIILPESRLLWEMRDRGYWEKEYNHHLSRWPDEMLEISELWKTAETGTDARRERIERWLQYADEFGIMLFSTCAHIHGC